MPTGRTRCFDYLDSYSEALSDVQSSFYLSRRGSLVENAGPIGNDYLVTLGGSLSQQPNSTGTGLATLVSVTR